MNLKAFRALQVENPRAAMIFDLTERFPRGPKGKLRAKHYNTKNDWGGNLHTPTSKALIGGDLGYDIHELYALARESFYRSEFRNITTRIEAAAMGGQYYNRGISNYEEGVYHLFKDGPQITRRIRRIEERMREVIKEMREVSDRNLYELRVGHFRHRLTVFGDSEEHAKMQYELLLKAGFEAGADAGYIDRGWGNPTNLRPATAFAGPSHGPHEIMAKNQEFVNNVETDIKRFEKEILEAQKKIDAAKDLIQLVNMFTINSCAQEFGEAAAE